MSVQGDAIDRILHGVRVMPVVVIDSADDAVPLANALLEGGLNAIEVTLRTEAAIEAVAAIRSDVPDMIVGTGTVLTPADLARSAKAGAVFAVSPGLTRTLATAAQEMVSTLPLLPGTASASEVMHGLEAGFTRLKFFPAEAAGGLPLLKSLGSPLPQAKFCPTGGISVKTAPDYLAQSNVFCVGGSWLTPKNIVAEGNWAEITRLAKEASAL
ncbi:MAG: bifunctional 4-hydroxy-2-oxoglutarate aldolase/2-dehydro-3-deoxy-phosphogluconate aldolase [Pseudomonadota bacterium]